jgi:hypothetical protein
MKKKKVSKKVNTTKKAAAPKVQFRPMTDRQIRYKRNRLMGMGVVNAARAAGYSESTALKNGQRRIGGLQANTGIKDHLDRAGLTDQVISQSFAEIALCSKKLHSCTIVVKNENGKLTVNQNSNDYVEIPDNAVRVKALENVCKMKKYIGPDPEEAPKRDLHIIVIKDRDNGKAGDPVRSDFEARYGVRSTNE